MKRLRTLALAGLLLLLSTAPAAAVRPSACALQLDVERVYEYGETVVLHVSGLTGVGGIDIFTSWRNRTDEANLFLVPGITEFDFTYGLPIPGEEPSPLVEPGLYRVHAHALDCEATTRFRVAR